MTATAAPTSAMWAELAPLASSVPQVVVVADPEPGLFGLVAGELLGVFGLAMPAGRPQ